MVVHLGAIDRSFATDDAATMQVNAMGTWNLFEASRLAGVRRVVHCSSSSATGLDASNPDMPPCYLPIDEAHPTHPTDAYGLSKLCGERIAEAFSRRGMEVLVIRPCFVAFPEMADFMAGKPGPEGRAEPMPYLRAYVGPEDCARGFAAATTVDYGGFEVFFLAAADVFATEPTVPRLEALYGATIPLRDRRCTSGSRAPRRSATQRRAPGWAGRRRQAGRHRCRNAAAIASILQRPRHRRRERSAIRHLRGRWRITLRSPYDAEGVAISMRWRQRYGTDTSQFAVRAQPRPGARRRVADRRGAREPLVQRRIPQRNGAPYSASIAHRRLGGEDICGGKEKDLEPAIVHRHSGGETLRAVLRPHVGAE